MAQIACLHTADSNVAVFEAARAKLGWPEGVLSHHVRADLFAAAEAAGALTEGVADLTREAVAGLSRDFPAVLMTCSTLGPALPTDTPAILRADGALAEAAVRDGGKVVVICAAPTTLQSTGDLFRAAAAKTGALIDIWWIDGAWDMFKAGQIDRYEQTLAEAADRARASGAQQVALAQASMAGASRRTRLQPPPLTVPDSGLVAAGQIIGLT